MRVKVEESSSLLFSKVLDADLPELLELRDDSSIASDWCARLYSSVLIAYLTSDLHALRECREEISRLKSEERCAILFVLADARSKLRERTVTPKLIKELGSQVIQGAAHHDAMANLINGELFFVSGLVADLLESYRDAKGFYQSAARFLENGGARKKALKAAQNAVVDESRIESNRNFTVEYDHIARKAMKNGYFQVAAVSFHNISREYQLIGGIEVALDYANRANELFEKYNGR